MSKYTEEYTERVLLAFHQQRMEADQLRADLAAARADSERLGQAENLLREVMHTQPIAIDMRRHIFNHLEKADAARKETTK